MADPVYGKYSDFDGGKLAAAFKWKINTVLELADFDYQICYYQGQYEATGDTKWLDLKKCGGKAREKSFG